MASLNGEAVHFERNALTINIALGAPDPPVSNQCAPEISRDVR
jgi:hypothetical protein